MINKKVMKVVVWLMLAAMVFSTLMVAISAIAGI